MEEADSDKRCTKIHYIERRKDLIIINNDEFYNLYQNSKILAKIYLEAFGINVG